MRRPFSVHSSGRNRLNNSLQTVDPPGSGIARSGAMRVCLGSRLRKKQCTGADPFIVRGSPTFRRGRKKASGPVAMQLISATHNPGSGHETMGSLSASFDIESKSFLRKNLEIHPMCLGIFST